MLHVIAIAADALQVQGRKAAEIASAVATSSTTSAHGAGGAAPSPPVRIGALPVESPVEAMVSLKEVELAYKLNAAVIETADAMLGSLLDAIDADDAR